MRLYLSAVVAFVISCSLPANAELLGAEWINEAELKKQSAFARQHNLLLTELRCRFAEGVENPGRSNVIFRADFTRTETAQPWGWTFDANAPLEGPERQARSAGFEIAYEDYFEISGVTWVRCRVWRLPQ